LDRRGTLFDTLLHLRLRPAHPRDADAIAALARAGFESYRAWAGPDWHPQVEGVVEAGFLRERLAWPQVWAAVAEDSGEIRGVVAFKPLLTERWSGDRLPGWAHVWMLFVDPQCWGRGIGRSLHGLAVEEMRRQGYRRARLWTPTQAEPARSLYERAGWLATGRLFADELALDLTVYELELVPRAG
jgi:ribosomal protein S18 acetylase RimI-like enzyme